jgi:hypothetical protein
MAGPIGDVRFWGWNGSYGPTNKPTRLTPSQTFARSRSLAEHRQL